MQLECRTYGSKSGADHAQRKMRDDFRFQARGERAVSWFSDSRLAFAFGSKHKIEWKSRLDRYEIEDNTNYICNGTPAASWIIWRSVRESLGTSAKTKKMYTAGRLCLGLGANCVLGTQAEQERQGQ